MNIEWYPGHMTRARRMMQENIKLIDIVIELVDARLPLSSKNPDIDKLAAGKARLLVINRKDMADDAVTNRWADYYRSKGFSVLCVDSKSGAGVRKVTGMVQEACREKIERDRRRSIRNRPLRAMVVGIPNVGKSTFINRLIGKNSAAVGNKPGVTRGKQWIKLSKTIDLLDTPGILWPKFEDQAVGMRLAVSGSISDDILDKTEMALYLIGYLKSSYPGVLEQRYGITVSGNDAADLEAIALARKCLAAGGAADMDRMAALLVDEFRTLKLGRISLEMPPEAGSGDE